MVRVQQCERAEGIRRRSLLRITVVRGVFILSLSQVGGVSGDGYGVEGSPHTVHEAFAGLGLERAAEVRRRHVADVTNVEVQTLQTSVTTYASRCRIFHTSGYPLSGFQ